MENYIIKVGDITYKPELTPHQFLWEAGILKFGVKAMINVDFALSILSKIGAGSNSQTDFVLQFTSLTLRKLSAHWR